VVGRTEQPVKVLSGNQVIKTLNLNSEVLEFEAKAGVKYKVVPLQNKLFTYETSHEKCFSHKGMIIQLESTFLSLRFFAFFARHKIINK
jgi:hypothetical protein